MKHHDKNGIEIKTGDLLYNPHDRDETHRVISDGLNLYLGDLDSPLERYSTESFWEIIE